ncbi:MAG: sugar ABC transporter substrate-binding protein [Candidatus Bipolaricaulis sp.]|nr:sugar ABC transporter substrate-binding protein [Candidatus Bipolaricaulis sp.]MDD5646374.1 sugar ABC transporter substrate-binding protein [Candidatus Bipolaricaulis sp.]
MRRSVQVLGGIAAILGLAAFTVGAVTLQFVTPVWQSDTVDVVDELVAEWNGAHPDIQVEVVSIAWENIDDFLLTSFRGGQAPDLFHEDPVVCYEYGMMGYAEPLNAYLDAETLADIPEKNWAGVKDDDGNLYGVPFLQETLVLFYNKTMFADAGIVPPADGLVSWAELRDYALRLTKRDASGQVTTWGLLAPLEQRLWWCLVEQNEGNVLVRHDDGTWHVEIDDAAREAIEFYTNLVTVDQVMPREILSYDFMSLLQGFKTGKYAMFSFGCWVRSWIERLTRNQLDWGMLQVKGPKRNVTEAGPQALSIYSGSKHKAEAAQFLAFFTNTENQARLAMADWLFPVRESALVRPEFQTEEDQWNVAYQWLEYAEDVKPHMFGFFAWEWQSFIPQIELVILGSQDLAAALQAATEQGNAFLRRMGLQ